MSEETNKPQSESPVERQLELVEPEDGMIRAYANHHQIGWTGFDVRLTFGELVDIAPEKIVIEQTTQVTMSWQTAKLLSDSLRVLIEKYEAVNGPITTPVVP